MLEKMKNFVRKKNICVLATVSDHKPYCSLMAYITDATCEEIYMVTHKNTTKFNNLQNNPSVSLLIDSRETQPRSSAEALTIDGVVIPLLDKNKKQKMRDRMLESFPHMKAFIRHRESELIRIKINSFLLLEGLTESHFISLPS
ncbi:MAG: pyridoxamine 5'-phosphate oxidase family protein [Desulfobacteraceae bacterium]|nr:pyridoxamine 5'-phosphate oxidase family protein [Desulfobacteraceae bacterium]MDH3573544.1 pyridoxamine 5'-phosphate oxidase family protein [Desulfobacteraceae bacterium]MDH3836583.1 pyridoxamine 5'-phosphate oxidase family protein [Desulfobacteraceae bacterium]MDH3873886.1 pyridoxamine 5'-phosphate oxidase family protein [Desulfobacteraceae bacterium]MDH3957398.1 pyridoxamine 5'-phosphate oxidase family protein [Desulfobacteraceae bacterium]